MINNLFKSSGRCHEGEQLRRSSTHAWNISRTSSYLPTFLFIISINNNDDDAVHCYLIIITIKHIYIRYNMYNITQG